MNTAGRLAPMYLYPSAVRSTNMETYAPDPEMASGKKANTWHFGMKEHIVAGSESGIIYGTVAAPANEHDITHLAELPDTPP